MAEVAEFSVAVEKNLWQYLKKSNSFQEELTKVTEDGDVTVNPLDSGAELILTGKCSESVEQAGSQLNQLFKDYQKRLETKNVVIPNVEVVARIVQVPGEFENGAYLHVNPDTGTICIIGTREEVAFSEGRIIERCNADDSVTSDEQRRVESGDETPKVEPDVVQNGGERSLNNGPNDSQVVQVDLELWKYMQKNLNYESQTRRIREDMHVSIVESVIVSEDSLTKTQLMISGPTNDVNGAVKAANDLIEICENNSTTLRVPCPDNRLFSKIAKLLKTLNKNNGLVSANDGTVCVTGSQAELADCREKLEKLGLKFVDQSPPEVAQTLNAETENEQPVTSLHTAMSAAPRELPMRDNTATTADFGSFREVPSRDLQQEQLEADARYAASLEREESRSFGGMAGGYGDIVSGFHGGFDGFGGAANEVPVERTLWKFVEQRWQSKLQEFHDTLGLRVIHEESQEGFVMLHLETESPDMMEIGRDALLEFLSPLQESVITINQKVNTELPDQVKQFMAKAAAETGAVVDFDRLNFFIIGPQIAVEACQKKISELFELVNSTTCD